MSPSNVYKTACASSMLQLIKSNQQLKEQLVKKIKRDCKKAEDIEGLVNATQAMLMSDVQDEELYD